MAQTPWEATWRARERGKMFPYADPGTQTRVGQPLRAYRRGGKILEANVCLNYSPFLKKEVSLQSKKTLFERET